MNTEKVIKLKLVGDYPYVKKNIDNKKSRTNIINESTEPNANSLSVTGVLVINYS